MPRAENQIWNPHMIRARLVGLPVATTSTSVTWDALMILMTYHHSNRNEAKVRRDCGSSPTILSHQSGLWKLIVAIPLVLVARQWRLCILTASSDMFPFSRRCVQKTSSVHVQCPSVADITDIVAHLNLVGGLEHVLFFYIFGIIIPTD